MTQIDPRALRAAFGSFMTGVTVVTCKDASGKPVGFTANSFSSVSLDPPLLLVCPGKFLSSYDAFATCTQFAVSILAEGQEDVANTFASYKCDRFARVAHHQDGLGNILVDGALAQFSCTLHQSLEAGDHMILIGEVQSFAQATGRGLGYAGGQFFSLELEHVALEHDGSASICGAIISNADRVYLEKTEDGYRPPQIVTDDPGLLRQNLTDALTAQKLAVKLGPAYSVFKQGKTQSAYFLGTPNGTDTSAFAALPIAQLSEMTFTTPAIAKMMQRFAREAQSRSYGLYLGDAQRGDIHPLPERT